LKAEWWFAGIAISVLGALAASAASLIKAARLPVLASAQPQAWQQAQQRWLKLQGAAAVLVLRWQRTAVVRGLAAGGFAVLAALMLVRHWRCRRSSSACWRWASAAPRSRCRAGSGPTAASNSPASRLP
jgi:hypothetical protein